MASLSSSNSRPHIVLFPFMSKGHTIPLLHLAHLLLDRGLTITIFTTPGNHPFIARSLPTSHHLSILDIPFPDDIPGIPRGTENTENLPSMSLFVSFVNGVKRMRPFFEQELHKIHSQVTCIISDGFLPWTLDSASSLGIRLLSFFGMSHYASVVTHEALTSRLLSLHVSDDEPFTLTRFPWIELTRSHFDEPFNQREPGGPHFDLVMEMAISMAKSHGLLVNSFYELEKVYADYCNQERKPKTWSIGPLCLEKLQKKILGRRPKWIDWLDQKLAEGSPVLYVAFGSQARLSPTQLREIAIGLEEASVSFLWVVKNSKLELLNEGFEDKVKERGIIVREWVDQDEILQHPAVQGFVSHCGWNSVLEGICAEVPFLAWPMMADQYLNAKAVVEEIKVGLRLCTVDGSPKGFVTADSLKNTVIELMKGETGKELRATVKEVAAAARKAVADGGSSWHELNELVSEMHRQKESDRCKLSQ